MTSILIEFGNILYLKLKNKSKKYAAVGIGNIPGRSQLYPFSAAVCNTEPMYRTENGEQLCMQIEYRV